MRLADRFSATGDMLFRWRSWLPLLLLPLLNMTGPYSIVRHPLYVGNYLIGLGRFGDAFRAWAARVPAVLPRPWTWRPPALPFSSARALDREFYAVGELTVAFFFLDVLEDWAVHGGLTLDPV